MRYENLQQMIEKSSSTRSYFLSLPVEVQSKLHGCSDYIHTAEELHRFVFEAETQERQIALSDSYGFSNSAGNQRDK